MLRQIKFKMAALSLATMLLIAGNGCSSPASEAGEKKEEAVKPVAPIAGFTAYDEQEKFGFKFQTPKDWEKDESKEADNATTAFYAPLENDQDVYRENFVVTAINIPSGEKITMDEFVNASHAGLKKSVNDVAITDTGEATLAGQKAQTFAFTGNISNDSGAKATIKGKEYYIINGGHAYAFTFSGANTQFDKYQPVADQIFGSVELK